MLATGNTEELGPVVLTMVLLVSTFTGALVERALLITAGDLVSLQPVIVHANIRLKKL